MALTEAEELELLELEEAEYQAGLAAPTTGASAAQPQETTVGRKMLEYLPTYTGIGGAALGSLAFPGGGTIVGGAAGFGVGKMAEQALAGALYDEEITPGKAMIDTTLEMTGMPALGRASRDVDAFTGALVRKAITEKFTGQDLAQAPSGADQAGMLGVPGTTLGEATGAPDWLGGNLSLRDAAGIPLEMAQDPISWALGALKVGGAGVRKFGEWRGGGSGGGPGARAAADAAAGARSAVDVAQDASASGKASGSASALAKTEIGPSSVEMSGELFGIRKPESVKELENWKTPIAEAETLTGHTRLREIEKKLNLQVPPMELHYQMLENPKSMQELKNKFSSLPSETSKQLEAYNYAMLTEAEQGVVREAQSIAKQAPRPLADEGVSVMTEIKDRYDAQKDALAPAFQKYQELAQPLNQDQVIQVQKALAEQTEIGPLMMMEPETGKIIVKANDPSTGLSAKEYQALSAVIERLNKPMTFKELQRVRDYLRKQVDPINVKETAELQKARGVLLDQLETMAGDIQPELRKTFTEYARNERAREQLETIMGGKVESLDAMFAANPDKVVQRLLANPNHANIARDYLGFEKFDEMVSAYVNEGISRAFHPVKGFQPHTLQAWIRKNETFLNRYVPADKVERLKAYTDHGYLARRFLDNVNPSGTAATLAEIMEPKKIAAKLQQGGFINTLESTAAGWVENKVSTHQATKAVNEAMAGARTEAKASAPSAREVMRNYLMDRYFQDAATGAGLRGTNRTEKPKDPPKGKPDQTRLFEQIRGTPYERVLRNALQQGGETSLAAANYVLSNRDPKYRELLTS